MGYSVAGVGSCMESIPKDIPFSTGATSMTYILDYLNDLLWFPFTYLFLDE
jgi:hypothetical protein